MEEQKWCMCETVGGVYRDGFSTCVKCGGKDAHKEYRNRPNGTVEQKYIYWHPGEDQPASLDGWMWYSSTSKEYKKRNEPDGLPLRNGQYYRKEVSNAEYRAHHWCKAHTTPVPKGFEIRRFGTIAYRGEYIFGYSFEVREVELGSIECYLPFPILEKIEPEIVWVTPTQQDVIDCIKATGDYPEAVFGKDGGGYQGKLVFVGDLFIAYDCDYFKHCKMNAALREEWR